jgi:hypothetical protein
MNPAHRKDLISMAQSINPAITSAVAKAVSGIPAGGNNAQLTALVNQILAQLRQLQNQVNNLPSGGSTVTNIFESSQFILSEDGDGGGDSIIVPGPPGSPGAAGVAGAQGSALFLEGSPGEDGFSIPGATGVAGLNGIAAIGAGLYASAGTPTGAEIYQCTDAPAELISTAGGSFNYTRYGTQVVTPPVAANFSWVNQGSATISSVGPFLYLLQAGLSAADSWAFQVESLPSTPYDHEIFILPDYLNRSYMQGGLAILASGATPKAVVFALVGQMPNSPSAGGLNAPEFQIIKLNSPTSFNSTYFNMGAPFIQDGIWLKVHDDGTNFTFYFGAKRNKYTQVYQVSRTDWLTPSVRGWGQDAQNSSSGTINAGMYLLHSTP